MAVKTVEIKVSDHVIGVALEADACQKLADSLANGWFPSLKAIFYARQASRYRAATMSALVSVYKVPDTVLDIQVDATTRTVKYEVQVEGELAPGSKPKKPRKPRAKKVVAPAAPTTPASAPAPVAVTSFPTMGNN